MPEESTTLLTTGVFKFSRNPIYLSLLNLLIAFSIYLGSFLGLIITPLFVVYINLFQIKPEEKAMFKLYGKEFENYCSNVRRWI
jgi:protein-S-isoprenylcysteine O-methyltransferase Ste14